MAIPTIKRTMELHSQQNGTAIQRNWSSCFQKYQCFESWDLEAKERQTYHSLQERDSMNTELLFQTVHSVNQVSVYGALTNWCYQFALKEEDKGRVGIIVDNIRF